MNTDDFIVGDRVWVNGVKPGYIQYIGETKFAPGEWAGVVLDTPTGKNDGSVLGRRYFYCEPNRGVFARLWRLTRYPIIPDKYRRSPSPDSGIYGTLRSKSPDRKVTTTSTTTFERREKSPTRSLSSNSSRDSLGKSVTFTTRPSKQVTTVTTTTTTMEPNLRYGPLRVGDRVYVNSTKGLLAGRLRYLGSTDFAPGYWAGVELEDCLGKNDGSVAGKRYFWCPNHYGLFAPAYKVVKADPKRLTTVTRITRASPEI
jgi:dynactin complex subunit